MHLQAVQRTDGGEDVLTLDWYAVYTKHQHERTASEALERKGFEVFLPLFQAKHRWKDRTKVVSVPIFPCYVFLRTALDRKLDVVRTPGVFWLVENGGRACRIPECEIEAIRKLTQSSLNVEPYPYLKCGDLVRVSGGVLDGVEGSLVKIKNRYRVVLSVHILQRSVAAEVDLSRVERVSSSPRNDVFIDSEARRAT